jgi:DNA-directed RNA polymerase specialized sigma24 family protein
MSQLRARNRELVLRYYQDEKHEKISNRKLMARELGIGLAALRIRAHRIRSQLQKCVEACLERVQK